ncbi:MAG: hypothetical protein L3J52_06700, partial [Proteobacteria bacterium]|nr:hypothetical protein [Pseudomonadota bacterium]
MKKIIISILVLGLLVSFYLTQRADEPGSKHLPSKEIRFKKEPKKFDKPGQAAQWISALRQTGKGDKNAAQLNEQLRGEIKLKEKFARINKVAGSNDIPNFQFEDIGPGTFGGRVRAMVIKPDEPDVLLVGSVSGGIWKSLNDGLSWQAKADFLPNIAIGSMVADPDNPNRVFVGTGEGVFSFGAVQGAGIFVSNDFGESWNQLASTNNNDFYYVNRMVRIPDSQIVLAATSKGIFRSENLGQSWTETSGLSNSARGFMDLKIDPSNDNHLLAVRYDGPNEGLSFTVKSPVGGAGNYGALQAAFGPDFEDFTISGEAVLVDDGSGVSVDGCEAINNDVSNKIAIIQRGGCNFTVKVKNAQDAGAVAVIVYNNSAGLLTMGGEDETISIPSAFISQVDGEFVLTAARSIVGSVSVTLKEVLSRSVLRSLDAGISWEILDNHGLPVRDLDRMELAFGNDGVIYVAAAKSDEASTTLGLWYSPGGDANFVKTASDTQFIERQGWFDLAIAVHPNDSDKVFMGAVDQFVSNNKGATIVKNSFWSPNATVTQVNKYVHADHHGYF